jgi:AP-1 complex subunit gamma-1
MHYLFCKVDLLGDDMSSPSDPVVSVPSGHKTNEDLLAEIFGGSTATSATPSPPSRPQKATANDILSLFDSPTPSAPPQAAPPSISSLFDLTSPVVPTAPPKPAAPKLPSYTAYNKNDLVILLTPQRSTTQPGVVEILASFQVKGNTAATSLNFQVAVPKVSSSRKESYEMTRQEENY